MILGESSPHHEIVIEESPVAACSLSQRPSRGVGLRGRWRAFSARILEAKNA
jgi:hypothetical protein